MLNAFLRKHRSRPEAKRRLYIHLGLHKTGTTSLQYLLHDNMQHLYDLGFLYPGAGRHPRAHVQHALIAWAMRPPASVRRNAGFGLAGDIDGELLLNALLHEIDLSGRDNIILSSEEFSVMEDNVISLFCSKFSGFELKPIIYIRNYLHLAEALYQTYVAYASLMDGFGSFDWMRRIRTDLHALCKAWSSHAFDGRIIVRNYDAPDFDIIEDFASMTGLDLSRMNLRERSRRLNQTLKPAIVVILRELRAGKFSSRHLQLLTKRLGETGYRDIGVALSLIEALQQDGRDDGKLYALGQELQKLHYRQPQSVIPPGERPGIIERYENEIRLLRKADFVKLDRSFRDPLARFSKEAQFIETVDEAISSIEAATEKALAQAPGWRFLL